MGKVDFVALHKMWKSYTSDRSKAKQIVNAKIEANKVTIDHLREANIRLVAEFEEEWRTTKERRQRQLDDAVMEELAIPGRSAQKILRELGSNNTVWIYHLRARVEAAGKIQPARNLNSP